MKPILTKLGHIGIKVGDKQFHLIPSLAAMAKLDNPVMMYHQLHQGDIETAYKVIEACSYDSDISYHLGQVIMPPVRIGDQVRPATTYDSAVIPDHKAVIIAISLLYHGIIGDFKVSKIAAKKKENYSEEFDSLKFASIAISELGMNQDEAWSLTMTQLRHALNIKHPPSAKEQAHDELLEDYDDMVEWRKQIYGEPTQQEEK